MHRPIDSPVTTMGPSGRMSDARRCWATSPDTAFTGTSHEDTSVQMDTRITMIRRPAWGDGIKRALPGGRLILRRLTHQVTKAKDRHEPTPEPQPRQGRYRVRRQARLDAETHATLEALANTVH